MQLTYIYKNECLFFINETNVFTFSCTDGLILSNATTKCRIEISGCPE